MIQPESLVVETDAIDRLLIEENLRGKEPFYPLADFFAAFYRPHPQLRPADDLGRLALVRKLLETSAAHKLRRQSALDPHMSTIGALAFYEHLSKDPEARKLLENAEKAEQAREQLRNLWLEALQHPPQDPAQRKQLADRMRQLRQDRDRFQGIAEKREVPVGVIRQAASRAQQATQMTGVLAGWSLETSPDRKEVFEVYEALQALQKLDPEKVELVREILQRAREYFQVAASAAAEKPSREPDEVKIRPERTFENLLPSELLLLDESMEFFYSKYLEGALLSYERSTPQRKKRSLVILVDESGSMQGDKWIASKALAWVLMRVALKQGIKVTICCFSGPGNSFCRAAPFDGTSLIEIFVHFFGGGTALEEHLGHAFSEPHRDVVLLTDGQAPLSEKMRELKRQRKLNLFTVLFGGRNQSLEQLSDYVAYYAPGKVELIKDLVKLIGEEQ